MSRKPRKLERPWSKPAVWVILLLMTSTFLSLSLGEGTISSKTIQNARTAWELSSQLENPLFTKGEVITQFVSGVGVRRAVLAFPLAFLYSLIGVNSLATIVLPLAGFAGTILLIYKIGELLADPKIGFWSAFLFLIIPENLSGSTVYAEYTFVLLFNLLAIYLALIFESAPNGTRKNFVLLAGFASALFSFLLAEWGGWVFVFLSLHLLRIRSKALTIAGVAGLVGLLFLVYNYLQPSRADLLSSNSPMQSLFSFSIVPYLLLLVTLGVVQTKKPSTQFFSLTWLLTSILWLTPYFFLGIPGVLGPVLCSITLIAAFSFQKIEVKSTPLVPIVACLSLLAWVIHLQLLATQLLVTDLSTVNGDPSWAVDNPLITWSEIVGGLFPYYILLGLFTSRLINRNLSPTYYVVSLLILLSALLEPLRALHFARASSLNVEEILETVSQLEPSLPLNVGDQEAKERLEFAQGFSNQPVTISQLGIQSPTEDGFFLVKELPQIQTLPNPWFIKQFLAGNHDAFWLIRSLSSKTATALYEGLESRDNSAERGPNLKLAGALINLGRCEGHAAWAEAIREASIVEVLPMLDTTCLADQIANMTDLSRTMSSSGSGWFSLPGRFVLVDYEIGEGRRVTKVLSYHPYDSRIYDSSSRFSHVVVKPDKYYLFLVRLQSEGLIGPLYWQLDGQEGVFLLAQTVPELTEFAMLIHTPSNLKDDHFYISPALFGESRAVLRVNETFFSEVNID
jgi:hypothetical protein